MELPWNICPYCGTPAPGMRREHLTLDEALRPMGVEDGVEEIPFFEPSEESVQLFEVEEQTGQDFVDEFEQAPDEAFEESDEGELEQEDEVEQSEPTEE